MSSPEIPTNTFNAVSINITGSNNKLKFIGNFIHIRIVLKQIANLFHICFTLAQDTGGEK